MTRQAYYKDDEFPSAISYGREFEDGASGSVSLPYVDSEAAVGTSARSTTRYVVQLRRLFASKGGRKLIVESFEEELLTGGVVSSVQVGRPRNLGVGAGSFDVLITVRAEGLRTDLHLSIFRVERVLGGLLTVGVAGRRVPLSAMTQLARVMAARMTVQLAPRATAAPTVTGTAAVGQTLDDDDRDVGRCPDELCPPVGAMRFRRGVLRCDPRGYESDIRGDRCRRRLLAPRECHRAERHRSRH